MLRSIEVTTGLERTGRSLRDRSGEMWSVTAGETQSS